MLPQVDENLDHNDHDDQCNEGGDHTYNMNYISVTSVDENLDHDDQCNEGGDHTYNMNYISVTSG